MKLSWRGPVYCVQLFAAVAFATACEHMIVDPAFPPTSVAFTPPPVYARWWDMTQSCSGITGSLAAVSWLVVPGTSDFQFKGQTVSGYWTAGSNSIVIADSVQLDGSVIRHEMLHALIKGSGHPRSDRPWCSAPGPCPSPSVPCGGTRLLSASCNLGLWQMSRLGT